MASERSGPDESMLEEDAFVFVYDRRESANPGKRVHTGGLFHFGDFKDRVIEVCV
jgi:hypothetical protein